MTIESIYIIKSYFTRSMHLQEINMYECLAEAFNEYGYACQTDGTYFEFTPLNLFVDATIENFSQSTDGMLSSIIRITPIILKERKDFE